MSGGVAGVVVAAAAVRRVEGLVEAEWCGNSMSKLGWVDCVAAVVALAEFVPVQGQLCEAHVVGCCKLR